MSSLSGSFRYTLCTMLRVLPKSLRYQPLSLPTRYFSAFRVPVKSVVRPIHYVPAAYIGSYQACWQLQSMVVRTNIDRWYENLKGQHFRLQYIDTCAKFPKDIRNSFPVVLAVPGSPGNHKELVSLMEPLVRKGVRVIMLNFPHFDYCYFLGEFHGRLKPTPVGREMFTNTTAERTEFIMRVLEQLEVPSIELAVAQGAGAVPVLLYLNATANLKAGMFVCPYPVHQPIALAKPLFLTKNMPQYHAQGLPKIYRWALTWLLCKMRGMKLRVSDERFNAIQVAVNIGFDAMPDYAKNFAEIKTPCSYVYTKRDPRVRHSVSAANARLMGIEAEHIWKVQPDDKWTGTGINENNKRALLFDVPTHYPQTKPGINDILVQEMLYLITAGNKVHEEKMRKQYEDMDNASIDVYNKENRKHVAN